MSLFAKDHLSNHEYDGIREYDNPTPGWWHLIFIGSVLFSFMYFVYYHSNPSAATPQSILQSQETSYNKKLFAAYGDVKNDLATLHKLMADPKMMDVGNAVFRTNCAQCHDATGKGINGVNLTDDSYKNVRQIEDVFNVITNGAQGGAMPSWKAQIDEKTRVLLSAYVASMRGKNIPGRAPEGEIIPAWASAPGTSDDTKGTK